MLLVSTIILLLAFMFVLEKKDVINFYTSTAEDSTSLETEADNIILNPPTDEEVNAGNEQKQEIIDQQDPEQTPQNENIVDVIIVDSTQYDSIIEVRAFASGSVKDGTCRITFTKSKTNFSKEVPAKADATTTPCLTLEVPRSEFNSSGIWQVEVVYTSENTSGTSSSTVEVL